MNEGALRSLEYDRVVEVVRSYALTPLGAARLATLRPRADFRSAQAALAATTECVRYLGANGPIALEAPADLEHILTRLAVEGLALDAVQLRGLAQLLSSIESVQRAVRGGQEGPYPSLRTMLEGCQSFSAEASAITSKIDDTGQVVDGASAELQGVRHRLQKHTSRLRGTLDSYLRGKDTARYLQEQVITERAGRFVLVVRAEHRGSIPGIVHGSSGSGASLFLEPLSTVEINNDIVALHEQEAAEVQRILLELSDLLRKRALDLHHTLTGATEIDEVQARASFSQLVGGTAPELITEPQLELRQARHPLLIPEVRQRLGAATAAAAPVPVDITIEPPASVLVVTGPNTGGKTVALKTAGLLSLMAMSGLHLPTAEGSRVMAFRSMFADIGDEQSITASVSTFSGHIQNIVSMDRHIRLPALVLLDEIGAGTDPLEGGALGAALIEHFRTRGVVVIATTHDEMIKSYAATTDGVSCAGFGFDPDTYAPNYRLTYGTPGRSLALEIAARLGVPDSVIQAARARRSARETQLADHLAKVDRDLHAISSERQKLAAERERLASDRAALESGARDLKTKEEDMRRQRTGSIDDRVRSARKAIEEVVDTLRRRAAELEQHASARAAAGEIPLTTGDTGTLRAEAHAALDAVGRHAEDDVEEHDDRPTEAPAPTATPGVGAIVKVDRLGLSGRVLALHDVEAEIDVRGKRLRVPMAELRATSDGASTSRPRGGRVTVHATETPDSLEELNVIGCTVDEALTRTERYLDQAILHAHRQVRVIHGHGTGALRRSIATLLEAHPQVEKFAPAQRERGGAGVTVVDLKD